MRSQAKSKCDDGDDDVDNDDDGDGGDGGDSGDGGDGDGVGVEVFSKCYMMSG